MNAHVLLTIYNHVAKHRRMQGMKLQSRRESINTPSSQAVSNLFLMSIGLGLLVLRNKFLSVKRVSNMKPFVSN
jgi:hypothetical protein